VLEKIAGELSDTVKIVKMNAAEQRSTAAKYGIQAVPTLFIFKNGDVADSLIGFQSEQDIRNRLNSVSQGS
jgi:thioredoxin 1